MQAIEDLTGDERPVVIKSFKVTASQHAALEAFQREHGDYVPNFTALVDEAVREYMQRRGARYPVTRFRRPW